MKTLREIQDEVAKDYGFNSYDLILESYERGVVSRYFFNDYLDDCFIETQRQAQLKIEKRVTEDCSNWNFDSQSIINDNNLIR